MIVARDLDIRVHGRALVEDVTLSLDVGELLVLAGPNGAGKSTLLRALSGDVVPSRGFVQILGRSLADWTTRDLARVRAVLPQHDALRFALPVQDLVALGRAPWRGHRDARRDREAIQRALEAAGVEDLAGRSCMTLSGGERQRVQLARTLAQLEPWRADRGPRYLLLDEPVSSLDPAQQHRVLALARSVARCGIGVVVVLHDLNLAAQYGDRIALLGSGRIAAQGSPDHVLTARHVREIFGLQVRVLPHPCLRCPLLIPEPAGEHSPAL